MPCLEHADDSRLQNNDSDEESWDEINEDDESATVCLFCEQTFSQIHPIALDHLRLEHLVDLNAMKARLNMDQYSFIKVIQLFGIFR